MHWRSWLNRTMISPGTAVGGLGLLFRLNTRDRKAGDDEDEREVRSPHGAPPG